MTLIWDRVPSQDGFAHLITTFPRGLAFIDQYHVRGFSYKIKLYPKHSPAFNISGDEFNTTLRDVIENAERAIKDGLD